MMIELSFGGYIDSVGHYCVIKITGDDIAQVLRQSVDTRNFLRKSKELFKTSGTRGETGNFGVSVSEK